MAVRNHGLQGTVRTACVLGFLCLLSACAVVQTPSITRVALFAPFEGRYREIGYNALYAARLALADAQDEYIELLPVDDGGTQAANHARALALDPLVKAVVVLGYDATSPETLAAFADLPLLVVGNWGAEAPAENHFFLSNPTLTQQVSTPPRISVTAAATLPAPLTGGDVFALEGFAELRGELEDVVVLSSGALPNAAFIERYKGSDPFAPDPGLLATLTYDATTIAISAAQAVTRADARHWIDSTQFVGINGTIQFDDGYWLEAPLNRYRYLEGALTDDPIE
jgi:hypothetical protein